MFTINERIHLIVSYGREDAIELYEQYYNKIDFGEYSLFKSQHALPSMSISKSLKDAIMFLEYCYQLRKDNYEDILDFFNTLRAIERQAIS